MTKNYLIDTHAHLNFTLGVNEEVNNSDADILELLKDMEFNGVKKVIIPSVDSKTMEKVVEISEKFENVYSMTGIFPTEAKTYTQEVKDKIIKLSQSKKVVAIGEVGLDYYWDKENAQIQKEVFVKQINIANELNLPLVIHDREAHKDCFDLLKEHNKGSKVLFHCFSGSPEFMKECVKEGWYIAIGGVVTFKNAVKMKEVAKEVPLDKLVLETDSPYLTPVPFRGKPNKPSYVKYVAEEIAKIRGVNTDEIITATTLNAEELFGI